MTGAPRVVALALVAALIGAAAFETAVALRWLDLGSEPGEAPAGRGYALAAAMLALFAGAALFIRVGTRPDQSADAVASVIGLAAAAFLLARFYSFDHYFAPTLRRYSDGGSVAPSLVYAVVGLALLAAVLVLLRPRVGFVLGAPVLLLAAVTSFAMGIGH